MKYLDERGLAHFYEKVKDRISCYTSEMREITENLENTKLDIPLYKSGNPVVFDNITGGVPFFDIVVKGENIEGKTLSLSVSGDNKNLLPYPYHDSSGKVSGGIIFDTDENGIVTMNGNASENAYFTLYEGSPVLFSGIVYISVTLSKFIGWYYSIQYEFYKDGICVNSGSFTGAEFNISADDYDKIVLKLKIDSGAVLSDVKAYCQIEYGSSATEFTPFVSDRYSIIPDSDCYRISFPVYQLNGKNVILVNNSAVSLDVYSDNNNMALMRIYQQLYSLEADKVNRETGKCLSSNDYTDEEKEKLAALENYDDTINLIPYPYTNQNYVNGEWTEAVEVGGVTFTPASDGIVLNGTNTSGARIIFSFAENFKLKAGETYTLSDSSEREFKSNIRIRYTDYNNMNSNLFGISTSKKVTYTAANDYNGMVYFSIDNGVSFDNVVFKPVFEIGNTAHAFKEYKDDLSSLIRSIIKRIDTLEG